MKTILAINGNFTFKFQKKMKITAVLCIILAFTSCRSTKNTSTTYNVGQIITPMGEMLFSLSDLTPHHKSSFIGLARDHYWDTLTFNRVIKNFVIQGGCPDTPEGFSRSPYLIKPEFHDSLRHVYGAVGIGRDDNPQKLSAGCQFYIVHNKNGIPRLDGNFMIIGQVFKGLDVLERIGNVNTDKTDKPIVPVTLKVNVIKMSEKEIKKNSIEN